MMNTLPFQLRDGHIFLELSGELWLFDTGAPTSFGTSRTLTIAGEQFSPKSTYQNLTAATLSQFVGVPCAGLLGADILGRFDHILDTAGGKLTISTAELPHGGQSVGLDEAMGIPIVTAVIGGRDYRMFFDTGAQVSYFQGGPLNMFPPAGNVTDFFPDIGQFQTDTHEVPVSIGGLTFTLRCGTLPRLLGMALGMANTQGIIGNAILKNRSVGYFPRRRTMML